MNALSPDPASVEAGRPVVGAAAVPRLAPHVRLRHDMVRDRWVVLAPERMLVPDEIAADVLRRVDGLRSVTTLAAALAADYQAPLAEVTADVIELLQDLVDKGFVDL